MAEENVSARRSSALSFVTAPDADADASALTTRLADFLPTMLPGCSAVVLHEMADSAPAALENVAG